MLHERFINLYGNKEKKRKKCWTFFLFFLQFGLKKTWIRIRNRIRIHFKSWIRIRIRIQLIRIHNSGSYHMLKNMRASC